MKDAAVFYSASVLTGKSSCQCELSLSAPFNVRFHHSATTRAFNSIESVEEFWQVCNFIFR